MKSPTAKDQSVREGDFCGGFILLGFYRGATLGAICSLVNRDNARLLAIHQFKRLPNLSMANSCSRRSGSLIGPRLGKRRFGSCAADWCRRRAQSSRSKRKWTRLSDISKR